MKENEHKHAAQCVEITVPTLYLSALKLILAKAKAYRYAGLNVHIAAKETLISATDGVVAGCFRLLQTATCPPGTPSIDVGIPAHLLDSLSLKDKGGEVALTIDNGLVTLAANGATVSGSMIDALPLTSFLRVLPRKVSGEVAQFDAECVNVFAQIAKKLGLRASNVLIGHNGADASLVCLCHADFFGVIMPYVSRSTTPPKTPPRWLTDAMNSPETVEDLV